MRTVLVLIVVAGAAAGEESASGIFTQAQVDAGRALADLTCSQCHTPALTGRNNQGELPPLTSLSAEFQAFVGKKGIVPPLVGPTFQDHVGSKTVPELVTFLQSALTTFLPERTDVDAGLNVTAYVLMKNGLKPGAQQLTMTNMTLVKSLFAAATPVAQGIFTQSQADAGRTAYSSTCGQCHTYALTGRKGDADELPAFSSLPTEYQEFIQRNGNHVAPLVGPAFLRNWGSHTTAELIRRLQDAVGPFPPAGANEETAVNLTAYVLRANGAQAGTQPLSKTTEVVINSVTVGRATEH